jgi:hypothetical protein
VEIRPFDKKVSAGDMTTRSASVTSRVISGGAVERAKVKKPVAAKAKPKAVIKKKVVKKPVVAKAKPKAAARGKTTKPAAQKKQTARSGGRTKPR